MGLTADALKKTPKHTMSHMHSSQGGGQVLWHIHRSGTKAAGVVCMPAMCSTVILPPLCCYCSSSWRSCCGERPPCSSPAGLAVTERPAFPQTPADRQPYWWPNEDWSSTEWLFMIWRGDMGSRAAHKQRCPAPQRGCLQGVLSSMDMLSSSLFLGLSLFSLCLSLPFSISLSPPFQSHRQREKPS